MISIVKGPQAEGVHTDSDSAAGLSWPDLRTPHYRLDWLGRTMAPASAALEALLEAESVDPRELAQIDGELGSFCCRQCEQNYCAKCWRTWPVFDDDGSMWFEEIRGVCPEGHEQRLQD